jgi:putative membrane protein
MQHLINVLRGFLMGSADIVPGASGGTVALVLGIYERLVHNIRTAAGALGSALRGRFRQARQRLGEVEWFFLIPLLAGIVAALFTLAALIEHLLENEPQATAAAFFGLVAGSITIAWRLVRRWDPMRLIVLVAVAAAAFVLLGLRSGEINDPVLWMFVGAGMVAIVAMILPGISGSFILLMLGMYEAVLAAVNDRDLGILAVFIVGAVIGLAAFSTLLDRLLRDYHDTVMAALIGLMAGSLRVLWPWPDGTDTAQLARPEDWGIPLIAALAGFVVVLVIGALSKRVQSSESTKRDLNSEF